MRIVTPNSISGDFLFGANGNEKSFTHKVRPIVILESNVKIDIGVKGKDDSSPEKAWVIR